MIDMQNIKRIYKTPECDILLLTAGSLICTSTMSPYDKPGGSMEEGDYWYEY